MIPKEKARQLYQKYETLGKDFTRGVSMRELAKECALIAVDEILWEIIKYADNSREHVVENSNYWQQVKQEIEQL